MEMNLTKKMISWAGLFGGLISFFPPVVLLVLAGILFVFVDCYTAYRLSVRVKKKYGKSQGKFTSEHGKRILNTLLEYFALVVLAYLLDKTILTFEDIYITKIIAGSFMFLQLVSILENMSSESNNTWASFMQNILTNKAARHFEINEKEFAEYMRMRDEIKKHKEMEKERIKRREK